MSIPANDKIDKMLKRSFHATMEIAIRSDEPGLVDTTTARKIVGHAALYNEVATIRTWFGDFTEVILPGAFSKCIDRDDVRALFNHDPNIILGRTKNGTLTLTDDDKGLGVSIIPPDTQQARDIMTLIERGDISQMSFAFTIPDGGQEWNDDYTHRTIKEVTLYDVSPVTYPAYAGTDVSVRSLREQRENVHVFIGQKRASLETMSISHRRHNGENQ